MVEAADRRVKGSRRGEGADVQLVDHRALYGRTAPPRVGPREGAMVTGPARPGRTVRLPGRPRVGQRLAAVKPVRVVGTVYGRDLRPPPARPLVGRHLVRLPGHVHLDPVSIGRPHGEDSHPVSYTHLR